MIAVSLSFPYEDTMVSRRGNGRFSTGILAFLYEETVVSLLETEISLTCLQGRVLKLSVAGKSRLAGNFRQRTFRM